MTKIEIKKTSVRLELVDILCDVCEKSTRDKYDMNYECAHLSADWGYGSQKDGDRWDLYFCEKCSDRIMDYIKGLYVKI